jgi:SAM-dependent methyltransferase
MWQPPVVTEPSGERWDQLASSYDAVADRYEQRFVDELDHKPFDRARLDAFARAVDGPVVDLGCGPGHVGRFLADRGARTIGVDLSEQMAALAARRLGLALVADMRSLPFRGGSLGGMVAFYSLIHLPRGELADAVAEIARVLRRGARLLVSVHGGEGEVVRDDFLEVPVPFVATLFDAGEIEAALVGAGMTITSVESRPPYEQESPTTRVYVGAEKR